MTFYLIIGGAFIGVGAVLYFVRKKPDTVQKTADELAKVANDITSKK